MGWFSPSSKSDKKDDKNAESDGEYTDGSYESYYESDSDSDSEEEGEAADDAAEEAGIIEYDGYVEVLRDQTQKEEDATADAGATEGQATEAVTSDAEAPATEPSESVAPISTASNAPEQVSVDRSPMSQENDIVAKLLQGGDDEDSESAEEPAKEDNQVERASRVVSEQESNQQAPADEKADDDSSTAPQLVELNGNSQANAPPPATIEPESSPPIQENSSFEDLPTTSNDVSADTDDDDESVEEATSFSDKQNLLVLAAEHDRVDILNAILAEDNEERELLLNSSIPPLHIAISFGSVNAAQSLLRMGADPSVRPSELPEGEALKVELKNASKFYGKSAWELCFGEESKSSKSWSVFSSSSSSMAPSKREGIRHAFTAESLRCIGSDQVERLKQLVESGMPVDTEIGNKGLYQWAIDMEAVECQKYLKPECADGDEKAAAEVADDSKETTDEEPSDSKKPSRRPTPVVLDRCSSASSELLTPSQLRNRLVELDQLGTALSKCLDDLAEENSVCHGLLSGGATALAAHVKSLKQIRYTTGLQLEKATRAWEQTSVEWERLRRLRETEEEGSSYSFAGDETNIEPAVSEKTKSSKSTHQASAEPTSEQSPAEGTSETAPPENDVKTRRIELLAEIAASENKVMKLRASIADLSEENDGNLKEVERRGLTGGINLVRSLRDELVDLEFRLRETQSATAERRAKMEILHGDDSQVDMPTLPPPRDSLTSDKEESEHGPTSLALTTAGGLTEESRGIFSIEIWRILLRLMGYDTASSSGSQSLLVV